MQRRTHEELLRHLCSEEGQGKQGVVAAPLAALLVLASRAVANGYLAGEYRRKVQHVYMTTVGRFSHSQRSFEMLCRIIMRQAAKLVTHKGSASSVAVALLDALCSFPIDTFSVTSSAVQGETRKAALLRSLLCIMHCTDSTSDVPKQLRIHPLQPEDTALLPAALVGIVARCHRDVRIEDFLEVFENPYLVEAVVKGTQLLRRVNAETEEASKVHVLPGAPSSLAVVFSQHGVSPQMEQRVALTPEQQDRLFALCTATTLHLAQGTLCALQRQHATEAHPMYPRLHAYLQSAVLFMSTYLLTMVSQDARLWRGDDAQTHHTRQRKVCKVMPHVLCALTLLGREDALLWGAYAAFVEGFETGGGTAVTPCGAALVLFATRHFAFPATLAIQRKEALRERAAQCTLQHIVSELPYDVHPEHKARLVSCVLDVLYTNDISSPMQSFFEDLFTNGVVKDDVFSVRGLEKGFYSGGGGSGAVEVLTAVLYTMRAHRRHFPRVLRIIIWKTGHNDPTHERYVFSGGLGRGEANVNTMLALERFDRVVRAKEKEGAVRSAQFVRQRLEQQVLREGIPLQGLHLFLAPYCVVGNYRGVSKAVFTLLHSCIDPVKKHVPPELRADEVFLALLRLNSFPKALLGAFVRAMRVHHPNSPYAKEIGRRLKSLK